MAFADTAYLVSSSRGQMPGSMTPFNLTRNALGLAHFVPSGAKQIAITPGSGEIWQATVSSNNLDPYWNAITIYDPADGALRAIIPFTSQVLKVSIDHAGRYAYVVLSNGTVSKIDIATRAIQQNLPVCTSNAGIVISPDDERLFTSGCSGILWSSIAPAH
jgi:hypothetical protein